MRGLKILVVAMGALIVVGIAAIAATIAGRTARHDVVPAQPFAAVPLDIPRGARIEALATGGERLVVGLALADGARRLVIFDLSTGRRLGTIDMQPAP